MSDGTYHLIELFVLGVPMWFGLFYMAAIFRLYPPHRHINGKIEYPPKYAPGRVDELNPGKGA